MKPVRYRVIDDYESPYPDPIVFRKGEQVAVGEEFLDNPEWRNWVWCTGTNDKQAWVPKQYLEIHGITGTLKEDYNARELSVEAGEVVVVYETVNGFAMTEKTDGLRGWVPLNRMELERK